MPTWKLLHYVLFQKRLECLERQMKYLLDTAPDRIKNHPDVKLYRALVQVMGEIRQDPTHADFLLGNTLGKEYRDWRRAKDRLPPRYRLFFKFFSGQYEIYLVWLNNEKTLRKDGAKTDCYRVFKRMLESGEMPSGRAELFADATACSMQPQ